MTREDIIGEDRLSVFDVYGTRCSATDFAILTGGLVSGGHYTSEGEDLKNLACFYWTKNKACYNEEVSHAVGYDGDLWDVDVDYCILGSRPVLSSSLIQLLSPNGSEGQVKNGTVEVELGMYPSYVVEDDISEELEKRYKSYSLFCFGTITDPSRVDKKTRTIPDEAKMECFEYNGKKYTRFIVG